MATHSIMETKHVLCTSLADATGIFRQRVHFATMSDKRHASEANAAKVLLQARVLRHRNAC